MIYIIVLVVVITGYVFLTFWSKEYALFESLTIGILAIANTITYIFTVFSRPEYAPINNSKDQDEKFLELLKKIQNEPNKKICAYCKIEKIEGARHCFVCKRCVLEHDKHMFILNNCIGAKNRHWAILYLF